MLTPRVLIISFLFVVVAPFLPPAVWIGMALWFILIGSIIFLYRRLWLR